MRVLGVILLVLVVALSFGSAFRCPPAYEKQYPSTYNQGYEEGCPTINGIAYRGVTAYIGDHIDEISAAITALATAAIAWFTLTIRDINRSELVHGHQTERAYMSCGGAPHRQPIDEPSIHAGIVVRRFVFTGNFEFHVNNHGKTPGKMTHYAVEFCDAQNIPADPIYNKISFKDWIGPGTQSRAMRLIKIPTDRITTAVYGRIYFEDIFGEEHSSGFLQTLSEADSTSLPGPSSYTFND